MNDDDHQELQEGGSGPPTRKVDRAAYAANWRQILLVDALVGVLVIVLGVVVLLLVSLLAGVVVAVAGGGYLLLGLTRWRRWARLRSEAGLDDPGASPTIG